jgi:hypothetical protein
VVVELPVFVMHADEQSILLVAALLALSAGRREWDYPDMAKEAGEKALADAGIPYSTVEQAVVGYVYGRCGVFFDPPELMQRCTLVRRWSSPPLHPLFVA